MRRLFGQFLLTFLVLTSAQLYASEGPEVLLDAMKIELQRNMNQLKVPDYPAPYFISYLMRDMHTQVVVVKHSAPIARRDDQQRVVFADVRVGSPELDNTEDPYPGLNSPAQFKPFGNNVPLVDDELSLRRALWNITDREYKKAVASFLKVKAQAIYENKSPNFKGSFSKARTAKEVESVRPFITDISPYEALAVKLSARLEEHPEIVESTVGFNATLHNRYFVNSEGARLFHSDTHYAFNVQAVARAEDGSVIPHAFVLYARTIDAIPNEEAMTLRVDLLIDELLALAKAPIMQPYNGPALLLEDTAGVFLHEALGHRLEGHRQNQQDEGGTFRGKLGDPILPDDISIFDDPTATEYESVEINGHYRFDDEGVRASRVTLVDNGKLAAFLMTRRPSEDMTQTNGHARASGTRRPVARMGTLILSSKDTVSQKVLKERLIETARAQGKPYGIILRRAASGATNTSAWGFQAFKGVARLVYRVDVKTGETTLVRGVDLVGTPLSSLTKIEAVGDTPTVFNGYCGAESGFVPVSTISPALLLRELEFQKSPQFREREEILAPPEE